MQLDIFEHSRDISLRNEVLRALQGQDQEQACRACDRLAHEFPADAWLADLRCLAEALPLGEGAPFATHAAAAVVRQAADEQLAPAALRCFGERDGRAWLVTLWRALAWRAEALSFRPEHATEHSAALLLQAGDWAAAASAVERIPSWRRIPIPLAWMVHARLRQTGLVATWPLVAELAWLAPARLEALVRIAAEPMLQQLVSHFEREFEDAAEPEGFSWLPAWVLTHRPQHASALAAAQASQHKPPEQALRLLVELLGLERQGRQRDIAERRKSLRDLHPGLYALYMQSR